MNKIKLSSMYGSFKPSPFEQLQRAYAPVNPKEIEQKKLHFKYTWLMYKLFCYNNNLVEGNYKNFRSWVHGNNIR